METCGCDSSSSHCQQQPKEKQSVGGPPSSTSSTDPNAYQIHGYTVLFPEGRKPFAAQLSVISKVLHALKEGKNALLESPTGTGKTLAILSSTLAYQASLLQTQAESSKTTTSNNSFDSLYNLDKEIDAALFEKTPMKKVDKEPAIPKVFYCSRTHSQLKQIVEEFRRCHPAYSKQPKMCILGSRSHLCINDQALELHAEGKPLDEVCQSLRDAHACKFIKKMTFADRTAYALRRMGVWDIEDAVEQGRECGGCSYYATRVIFEEARYILSPYNYLLDPSIRKALKIDLSGAIVVFDEAHNIEDVAREGASIDVLPNVFALCLYELEKVLKEDDSYIYINRIIEFIRQLGSWVQEMGETLFHGSSSVKASTPSDRSTLNRSKGNGGQKYTQASQSRYGSQQSTDDQECVWDGEEFLYIFSTRYQLTEAALAVYNELLHRLEESQDEAKELRAKSKEGDERRETYVPIISTLTISFLRKLFSILDFMMRNNQSRATDFRIVIQKVENESSRSATSSKRRKSNTSTEIIEARTVYPVSFHIWCMTAAVVFEDLVGSARSIILTSGTLSPLDAFATELGTPFPIRLEARHVIDLSKQLFAATFDSFDGHSLLSTYQHQQSDAYLDVVGRALMMLIRLTPGGTLLFVPSYRLLQRLYERWNRSGLLEEIEKIVSCHIYFEQKTNNDMSSVLQTYYNDLSVKGGKAAMVAVCRGKVSEGINFSDHYARTVAVLGIPFPALYDLQVHLKKDYQDRKFGAVVNNNNPATQTNANISSPFAGAYNADANFTPASATKGSMGQSSNTYYTPFKTAVPPPFYAAATSETVPLSCISGKMWYNQQAFRAINQAIGRCIRHRNDFGSIILLDPRFHQDNIVHNLSRWMRDETRHFDRLEDCILPLQRFFQPFDSYSTLDHGEKEEKKVKQKRQPVKIKIEEEEEEDKETVDEQEENKKPVQHRTSRGSIFEAFSKIIKQQQNERVQKSSPLNSPCRPTVVSSPTRGQTRSNAEGELGEENEAESRLSRLQVSPSSSTVKTTRGAVLHHLHNLWKDVFIPPGEESMVEGFGWIEQLENTLPPQLSALHELFSPGALVDISTENLLPGGNVPWHFLIASVGANNTATAGQLRGNEILRFPWMNRSLFSSSSAGSVISHAMDNKLIVVSEEWHKADQVVYQLVFLSISNEMGNTSSCGSPLVNENELDDFCSEYELLAAKIIATAPAQASMLYKTFVKHSIIN